MKIFILEDERLAAQQLEQLLLDIDDTCKIIGSAKSVESGLEWFKTNTPPDLIFSDIRLLDGLSFDLFQQIDVNIPIIFTTAYDQYAIRAFETNSIDYLLKPIQKDKLMASLGKYKLLMASHSPAPDYSDVLKALSKRDQEYKMRFMIRNGNKILAIPVEKIAYFYSQNKLTHIVTEDGKRYPYDQPLEVIDQQLDPRIFFRANRKYVISFASIAEIHPYFKGRIKINLTPETDDEVVISAEKTPEFKIWLDQ